MVFNKCCKLLALSSMTVLAVKNVEAFTPASLTNQRKNLATTLTKVGASDVSIPYDSAAKLSYEEWRGKFGKGDYDEQRFQSFKDNYEAIAVANVIAAKEAREASVVKGEGAAIITGSRMELNEYADMTLEEYEAALVDGGSSSTFTQEAQKSADAQAGASASLEAAGDALAQEEADLAKKLGLKSVVELEAAVDAMDGIGEDGVQMDPDNLAREARVRSSYLEWCKENDKLPNENRYPVFESNYLEMEKFANESGTEMQLNSYADCLEEEYEKLTAPTIPKEKKPAPPQKVGKKVFATSPQAVPTAPPAKKPAFGGMKMPKLPKMPSLGTPTKESPEEKGKKAAIALQKKEVAKQQREKAASSFAENKKKAEEAKANREKESAALVAEVEKDKKSRQAAQEKEAEKLRLSAEATAIAAAKAEADREATQVAKRRKLQEEADSMAREKAKEQQARLAEAAKESAAESARILEASQAALAIKAAAEAKQKAELDAKVAGRAKAAALAIPVAASKPKTKVAGSSAKKVGLGSFFGGGNATESKIPAKPVAKKVEEVVAPKVEEKAPIKKASLKKAAPAFSLFGGGSEKKSILVPATKKPSDPTPSLKTPVPKAAKALEVDVADPVSEAFGSFFGVGKKKEPTESKKPSPAPKIPSPAPQPNPAPANFFGSKKATSAPKAAPTPKPVPAKVAAPQPFFSFGGKPVAAKKQAPKPEPTPAPAAKKPEPFSLFAKPPAAKKAPAPAPASVPLRKKPEPFSFFNAPATKKAAPKQAPVPDPAPSQPSFSFFKAATRAPKKAAPPAPAPAAKKPEPFSFFGSKPAEKKIEPAPAPKQQAFSFFKSPAKKEEKDTPVPVKKGMGTKPLFGFGLAEKKLQRPPQDNIPVLTDWEQNPDGSLTGKVTNSKSFRRNEVITTSSVRRGAKAGTVVKTSSGSQYRLN